jgi:hypothetical protein
MLRVVRLSVAATCSPVKVVAADLRNLDLPGSGCARASEGERLVSISYNSSLRLR